METLVPLLGPWVWWVVAGVFLMLELLAPGVFFIWLAIAAAITGAADNLLGLPWQAEALLFALAAALSVYTGRMFLRRRQESDHPDLNRRQKGYVGRSFVLKEPIREGKGRLTIDDTVWEVRGADAPAGTRVTVTGSEGLRLLVTPG
jgi:hypothetical protein